jgi:hypothetical protein
MGRDKWELVIMAWHIFSLQMEERPPEMEGNYDILNKTLIQPARVDPPS